MGYDQVAYLDIDNQEDVSRFIADNGLDPTDWKDTERIGAAFGARTRREASAGQRSRLGLRVQRIV